MRKLLVLTFVALAISILLPTPARATGHFPTTYGCEPVAGGYFVGLAGGTYVNDASAYGIAWAITESNYFYTPPNCTPVASELTVTRWLIVNAWVDRYFQGTWIRCYSRRVQFDQVSHMDFSDGMEIGPWSPCTWANYPAGLTRINMFGGYQAFNLARSYNWTFYS